MTIAWQQSYAIGDVEIDKQHRQLFRLANEFLAAEDKAAQAVCAMHFYRYTREHFEYEENLMRRHGFPGLAEHVEGHNALIARLNQVGSGIEDGSLDRQELEDFIRDWAQHHIPVEDFRLSAYLSSR